MVKIYKQPFAHSGDAIAIPSASQPDGKMSSADGWTPDYQLLKTDPNYKPVGRQEMNGVFKEITEALGQVQVQGSATWSADGAPYPINAQVYHSGKQWIALRENSVEPAEGADWSAVMPQKAVTDAINNNSIGVGQTWQDMTGSRSTDVTYTNTTGRTIYVFCSLDTITGSEVTIDGISAPLLNSVDGDEPVSFSFIVPAGGAYSTTLTGVGKWLELR